MENQPPEEDILEQQRLSKRRAEEAVHTQRIKKLTAEELLEQQREEKRRAWKAVKAHRKTMQITLDNLQKQKDEVAASQKAVHANRERAARVRGEKISTLQRRQAAQAEVKKILTERKAAREAQRPRE